MNHNTPKARMKLGSLLLAAVITLISFTAGAVSTIWMSEAVAEALGIVLWLIPAGLFILLALFSYVGGKLYLSRLNHKKVAEVKNFVLARKEAAEADPASVMGKIRGIQFLLWGFYLAFAILLILSFCGVGIASIYIENATVMGVILPWFFLLSVVVDRIALLLEKPDFSQYTTRESIPELYRIAESAAEAVGVEIKGEIRIVLLPDCNAGICRMGKDVSLQLGNQLISVLHPQELYQILLHEFAHLQCETNVYRFGTGYAYRFLHEGGGNWGDDILDGILLFPAALSSYEYEICHTVISEYSERIADEAIRQKGDPAVASAALCKTAMSMLFDQEMDDFISEHFYAPEEPRSDSSQLLCTAFAKAIVQRGDAWRSLMDVELLRPLGSHPIFRQRWEALGSPAFEITLPDENTAYFADCLQAQKLVSARMRDNIKDDYPKLREEHYLAPLRQIEEFEQSDRVLTAPEIPEILRAYGQVGKYCEQEALCDRILADESLSEHETVSALYVKGLLLLDRYDEAGVDMVYRAMEINSNYVDAGLERVGNFLHWMGLADRMELHREKAVELAQENRDLIWHTGILTPSDRLIAEDFDGDGRLSEMLNYMVEAGEGNLLEIYLVRKIITVDFFTSAFVLRYEYGLSPEQREEIHDRIFRYLDNYPIDWQYSLFDYDQQTEKAVKKVSTSCVYRKK